MSQQIRFNARDISDARKLLKVLP